MEIGLQVAIAGLVSHMLEWMKRSNAVSFITPFADGITKIIAAVIAVLVTVGITTSWVVDPVTNLGTLAFAGIPSTAGGWLTLGVTAFQQYWFQKGYYLTAIKPHMAGVKTRGPGTGDTTGLSRDLT